MVEGFAACPFSGISGDCDLEYCRGPQELFDSKFSDCVTLRDTYGMLKC